MSKLVIGVDMGHSLTGAGSGAVGIKKETDMNRLAGKRLISMLQEKGHTVVNCTVDSASTTDNQLFGIVQKANAQTLDVFVSLHLNSFADASANGVETYIWNGSWNTKEANRAIAKKVNDKLATTIGWYNRGVKEANYYVLSATKAPAILIELGFCSNKGDMDKWNTEKIAMAIFEGITGTTYQSIQTTTNELYRIRKTWADVSSQKGAYSNLDSAIAECKKYSGYSVFNSSGVKVYPTSSDCDTQIKKESKVGRFTTTVSSIYFRDKPCTCHGKIQDSYYKGESVYYDSIITTEKYTWISWVGTTGTRRYMPVIDRKTNEKWGTGI